MTYGDFGAEMINEIIDIYISEHEDRFKTLKQNIAEGDMDALGKNAHSLKGATAVLYDNEVAELARQLEMKGKDFPFDKPKISQKAVEDGRMKDYLN